MKRTISKLTRAAVCLFGFGAMAQDANLPGVSRPLAKGYLKAAEVSFTGNKTFTQIEIRAGLRQSAAFLAAGHPVYMDPLEVAEGVAMGYRLQGFPRAKVKWLDEVKVDGIWQKVPPPWRFSIEEGPRYRCGKILLPGLPEKLAEAARREVLVWRAFDTRIPDWRPGKPLPATQEQFREWARRAQFSLRASGRPKAWVTAKLVYLPETGVCDLLLTVGEVPENERFILKKVEIEGLERNRPEEILKYMGMKLGEPNPEEGWKSPMKSGRFLAGEFGLVPGENPAHLTCRMTLKENPHAPLLREPLPEWQQAMLDVFQPLGSERPKFGAKETVFELRWNSKDAEIKLLGMVPLQHGVLRYAMGIDGKVVTISHPKAKLADSLVFGIMDQRDGIKGMIIGGKTKKKWTVTPETIVAGGVFMQMVAGTRPQPGPDGDVGYFTFGPGFRLEQDSPFKLKLKIQPGAVFEFTRKNFPLAAALQKSAKTETRTEGDRKIQTIRLPTMLFTREWNTKTGELLAARLDGSVDGIRIKAGWKQQVGVVAALSHDLIQLAKNLPNQRKPGKPFSSMAGFLAAGVIEIVQSIEAIQAESPLAKEMSDFGAKLPPALQPIDEIVVQLNRRTRFFVPANLSQHRGIAQASGGVQWRASDEYGERDKKLRSLGLITGMAMTYPELFFKESSWAHLLANEFRLKRLGLTSPGISRQLCLKLVQEMKMGPIGHRIAAQLLNESNAGGGEEIAKQGLELMNVVGFNRDLDVLAIKDSILIKFISQVAPVFGKENSTVSATLRSVIGQSALFSIENGEVIQFLNRHHDRLQKNPEAVIREVLTAQWPRIAPGLFMQLSLEKFGTRERLRELAKAGSAHAQFQLGLILAQGRGVPQELVEAYVWATRAARKGHRDAARLRAAIIRQMTTDQFSEGMKRVSE